MVKATYTTGSTGPEFTDKQAVANRDTTILPAMVNAVPNPDTRDKHEATPEAVKQEENKR